MSQFKIKTPVIHIPSFKEYRITGVELARKYYDLNVQIPFPISDHFYYHSDVKGWAKILPDLVIKSGLYLKDRTDCDWYARKAFVTCCERYGQNTLLYTYGFMPLGPHGFNSFWTGDVIMLFEPNSGFMDSQRKWEDLWGYLGGDIVFAIGENEYYPTDVLL